MATQAVDRKRTLKPGDLLLIRLTHEGIRRIPHLVVLQENGYIEVSPEERRRWQFLRTQDRWPWNDNRVIRLIATGRCSPRSLTRALGGFTEGRICWVPADKVTSESAAISAAAKSQPQRGASGLDLQLVEGMLDTGLTQARLAQFIQVTPRTIANWHRAWREGKTTIRSFAKSGGERLARLHQITVILLENKLNGEEAVLWWGCTNSLLGGAKPSELLSDPEQIQLLQIAAQSATPFPVHLGPTERD